MYARFEASPDDRADVRALLRARLLDVLLGAFDRHRKQWRWARIPGSPLWQPFPEDRDQALARYEGVLPAAVGRYVPQIQSFGPRYADISDLTYNGREQDRWLLAELEREAWHAEAGALQAALGDEVLERAARRMPAEWYPLDGPRLVAAMKKRREQLVKEADVFYEHLAGQVDVQATNAAELARVQRLEDGGVRVEVARLGADGAPEFLFCPWSSLQMSVSDAVGYPWRSAAILTWLLLRLLPT